MPRSADHPDDLAVKSDGMRSDSASAGFSAVARRVASRTTDLIAIGVVLIGGLGMGRQVVEWWQAEPPVVALTSGADSPALPWGASDMAVDLQFGDYPLTLRRQTVSGDREAAMGALVDACRRSLESPPQTALPTGNAADRILAHVASLQPVAESAGAWQIYRLEEQFSLVVGVHLSAAQETAQEESDDPFGGKRLAGWGFLVPFDVATWTLYFFQPSLPHGDSVAGHSQDQESLHTPVKSPASVAAIPDLPLPPEGQRLLSLRGTDGGGWIGFGGRGVPQEWTTFFDERLQKQGWSTKNGWSNGDGRWSVQHEPTKLMTKPFPNTRPPESVHRAHITIELSRDAADGLLGLIQIVP